MLTQAGAQCSVFSVYGEEDDVVLEQEELPATKVLNTAQSFPRRRSTDEKPRMMRRGSQTCSSFHSLTDLDINDPLEDSDESDSRSETTSTTAADSEELEPLKNEVKELEPWKNEVKDFEVKDQERKVSIVPASTTTESSLAVAWAVVFAIIGGCFATVPFEILNRADRGCSDFILFAQNVYTVVEGICSHGMYVFVVDRKMPFFIHIVNALFELTRNGLFNAAIDMALPMPVYLVIKNSGLVVSMVLGMTLQGKRYSFAQMAGVLTITVGVILATLSAKRKSSASASSAPALDNTTFTFVMLLMVGGVVVTALMNVVQEAGFRKYGKHYAETTFFASGLMLPLSLFKSPGPLALLSRAKAWCLHWDRLPLPFPFAIQVPSLWLLLLLSIASASLMKVSCLKLTGLAGQVANTLTVTVFRFVSLVISACVLNGPPYPNLDFWIGGVMVLAGTFSYALMAPAVKNKNKEKRQ